MKSSHWLQWPFSWLLILSSQTEGYYHIFLMHLSLKGTNAICSKENQIPESTAVICLYRYKTLHERNDPWFFPWKAFLPSGNTWETPGTHLSAPQPTSSWMPVKLPTSIANSLFGKETKMVGGGIVNGVISLIFLLAVAAQRVPHAKPQSTCTYSWQKSCGFAGFPLGFCLLFRHPPEHVTVGLLGSLRLFRVIRTTLHTNKTAFNCVEMSDKTTLSLEMKAAYGSTEVTEQRQETSKIGLTSWTLGWLLW